MKWRGLYALGKRSQSFVEEPAIPAPTTEQVEVLKLNDVFAQSTRAHRRNLMIASSAAILLTLGGEHFTSTFFIKLGDSDSRSIATGALWIVSFYECICFIAYGIRDLKAWQLDLFSKVVEYERRAVAELSRRAESIEANLALIVHNASTAKVNLADVLTHQTPLPSGTFEQLRKLADAGIRDINRLNSLTTSYNKWGIGQLVLIDWFLPIGFFCFMSYRALPDAISLLGQLF